MADLIDCPHAPTWASLCLARDGHGALAETRCAGCDLTPLALIRNLGWTTTGKPGRPTTRKAADRADEFRDLVRAYVDRP